MDVSLTAWVFDYLTQTTVCETKRLCLRSVSSTGTPQQAVLSPFIFTLHLRLPVQLRDQSFSEIVWWLCSCLVYQWWTRGWVKGTRWNDLPSATKTASLSIFKKLIKTQLFREHLLQGKCHFVSTHPVLPYPLNFLFLHFPLCLHSISTLSLRHLWHSLTSGFLLRSLLLALMLAVMLYLYL